MTKVYIAIALIAAILAAGFLEMHTAVNAADEMLSLIELADEAAQSESKRTKELCADTAELWEKCRPRLQIFFPHGDINEVSIDVEQALLYAEEKDYTNVRSSLSELALRMRILRESEEINVYNLM